MKKLLALVIGMVMVLSLVGCGKSTTNSGTNATVTKSATNEAPTVAATGTAKTYDQTWTIKFAYTQGDMAREDSAEITYAELFKEKVEANSNGAIKVELYPSGQLGTAQENVQGLIANNLEMACVNISLLNTVYKDTMLLSTPGLFNSEEECDAVLAGDWGKNFFTEMEDGTGIKMLTAISNGFRSFTTSNKELTTVDTAKGVKWRVMESPVSIKMVEALGAIPVPMSGSEMYTAMQNGTVDGQENPVINILNDKTYEVQKYMVMDKHMASIVTFIMSDKFYDTLPAELQQVVLDTVATITPESQKVIKTLNANGISKLEELGMSIYIPTDSELQAWHDKVSAPCVEYIRGELGNEIVDSLLSAIDTQRK